MVEKVSELGASGHERRREYTEAVRSEDARSCLQDDDEAPGPLQKIRASICEIAELFAQKYLDAFPQLGSFVSGVWTMLTTIGPGIREDVVSNCRLVDDES